MPLWKIAYRSIQFRRVSSMLTAFSMSLGVAIIVTVLVIHGVLSDSFNRSAQGYDLIIAGKGSPLDVVLSTVFYLRPPVGEVPESYLKAFRKGVFANITEEAIPIAIGHHFRGATIVGTTPEFFSKLKYRGDREYTFAEGENIKFGGDFTAVAGSRAAVKAGLKTGSEFTPEAAQEAGAHHHPFKIVGVLDPTGTPNDGAIFVNIDGFYDMHGHEHSNAEEQKHYSAILLMTKETQVGASGQPIPQNMNIIDVNAPDFDAAKLLEDRAVVNIDAMKLPQVLDKTTDVQAVSPVREITTLLTSIIGNIQMVLIFLAVMVVIVAGIGMMTAIYNSMSERKQEIAVMRALGARRLTVFSIILLESILLSLGGGVLGVLFGHVIIAGISPWISEYTGMIVRFWNFQAAEMYLIPGLIVLASIVGFLPALVAYKQDVAASLTA